MSRSGKDDEQRRESADGSKAAPPFTSLRALEAASRHRNFSSAARELKVTHSAVIQSIRRLEAELGATLFERRGAMMEPSSAALRLAQSYAEAAEALKAAITEVSEQVEPASTAAAASAGSRPRLGRRAES